MLPPDSLILLGVIESPHPRLRFFFRVILDLVDSRQCIEADIAIFQRALNDPLVDPH